MLPERGELEVDGIKRFGPDDDILFPSPEQHPAPRFRAKLTRWLRELLAALAEGRGAQCPALSPIARVRSEAAL